MRWRDMTLAVAVSVLAPSVQLQAAELATLRSAEWSLTIRYSEDLTASTTFKQNEFDRGAWRVSYAADTGPGTRIVAFSLPDLKTSDAGGDGIATAELRIGASRDPDVVAGCTTYGMNSGNNAFMNQRAIGGTLFTEVPDNSDGEAPRTIATDDLRAVRKGTCYAIDLILFVGGASNAHLAYPASQVDRLKSVLDGIHFD